MGHLPVSVGDRLDVVFTPRLSSWQGRERLELALTDVRRATAGNMTEATETAVESVIP